jgi:general secretion pathway protein G
MNMKKGFTLIEIMVVIVILGILIAMVSGSFVASQKKSRDLKRKSDVVQIGKALEVYYVDRGSYPLADAGSIVGCGIDPQVPTVCTWGVSEWSNTTTTPVTIYMAKIPSDPKGNTYYYDSDGTYYQIYAKLENTDDKDINKNGTAVQTYIGTDCGGGECQYGTSSTNATPEKNHALH